MPVSGFRARVRAILKAWPPAGAVFMALAFSVTVWWLLDGAYLNRGIGWLEPLAALLGGLGAFILAAILIFRKVDSARANADCYGLPRGLATGYYFNFIQPLFRALRDPDNEIHRLAGGNGASQIVGTVIGKPETAREFDTDNHDGIFADLQQADAIELHEIRFNAPGRPRPLAVRLAVNLLSGKAVVVDVPTTLAVIQDFAAYISKSDTELSSSADEFVTEARQQLVTAVETDKFCDILQEFDETIIRIGARESWGESPVSSLYLVTVAGMREAVQMLTKA